MREREAARFRYISCRPRSVSDEPGHVLVTLPTLVPEMTWEEEGSNAPTGQKGKKVGQEWAAKKERDDVTR